MLVHKHSNHKLFHQKTETKKKKITESQTHLLYNTLNLLLTDFKLKGKGNLYS